MFALLGLFDLYEYLVFASLRVRASKIFLLTSIECVPSLVKISLENPYAESTYARDILTIPPVWLLPTASFERKKNPYGRSVKFFKETKGTTEATRLHFVFRDSSKGPNCNVPLVE